MTIFDGSNASFDLELESLFSLKIVLVLGKNLAFLCIGRFLRVWKVYEFSDYFSIFCIILYVIFCDYT